MALASLKRAAPTVASTGRSDERQNLADAIAVRDAAKEVVAALERSIGAIAEKIEAAREAKYAAEEAAAAAKSAMALHRVDVELGRGGSPPSTPAEVRATADKARADLEALEEDLGALRGLRGERDRSLGYKEAAVQRARDEVVRSDPAVKALVTKYLALYAEFDAHRQIMFFLDGLLPSEPRAPTAWPIQQVLPANAPWRLALAALEADADAKLPE